MPLVLKDGVKRETKLRNKNVNFKGNSVIIIKINSPIIFHQKINKQIYLLFKHVKN
jgi:hypothetical protein